ncbi:hypothetical protein [Streptomyces sp. NBC_00645]|uniref:hypothetical protein n=1 Tax=Streptomyces sp. NBC_00645 TaxID=2975795 RepID=UPI0032493371
MTQLARPWYEDLTDSVTALREAAYEYKAAHRASVTLRDSVTMERRRLEDGRVSAQPAPTEQGLAPVPRSREPHANAVFDLASTYGKLTSSFLERFEHAALLYASGAAWAIRYVQQGHNPNGVLFQTSDTGRLVPGALEITGLDRYSEQAHVAAAYEAVAGCLDASRYGEELAEEDYLADHQASAMHDAWQHAEGTGPAAYAYGLLAERALRYVLLPARHGTPVV